MKRIFLPLLLLVCSLYGAITIDGRLDEPEWQTAKENKDFKALGTATNKIVQAQTSFKVLSMEDRIYIGVKCEEPLMDRLKEITAKKSSSAIWEDDAVEIFLTPTGNACSEFYQFLVCYDDKSWTNYWMESGHIRPDPYFPEWSHKVYSGKDFWSAEVEIPLSAFYMTPQQLWKTEWAVNIGRKRNPIRERTTFTQMLNGYFEPEKFAKLGGFPMRKPEDYVHISAAKANIKSQENGKPVGELSVNVNLYRAGEYELLGKAFKLNSGLHTLNVPYVFEKEGKNQVEIALRRTKDGHVFRRWYPVNAKFEPIKFKLNWPQYRNNFYPGQDYSRIEGEIECQLNEPLQLSISGSGIKPQTLKLKPGKKEFGFKTDGMQYGNAIIKAEVGGISCELKVRRLEPASTRMVWVEDGNLIVMNPGDKKGKAILPRRMYATYYRGGEAFKKRFDGDKDLHLENTACCSPSIEPVRLVKNIEVNYGLYDVKPPQELFDKIAEIIEKNKTRDFHYYYLYDEPECNNISPIFLKYVYDFVAEKDPYHPLMMASRGCSLYIDCCDWFETHPYINAMIDDGKRIYDRSFDSLGKYLDEISLSGRKDKVIGFLPTCFSYRYSNALSVYPTFQEIVCHTWAAMIHGGKSLWPYAYMDMGDRPCLYEGMRYIFSTFDVLQDFMLFAKRTVLHRSDEYEVVLYELGKEKMFAAVNFTTSEQKVAIKGQNGNYMEFRGKRSFKGISFTLKPQEAIIGTTQKRDTGLPTYQEVQAKIDELEAQRLAMPNLLLGHINDIEVTTSRPIRFWYKLFDGVRDVYAYDDAWGKCRFVEFSFKRNFMPKFSSLSIYGKNIEDAIVKIRKAGEWQELKPASTQKEGYMLKYLYSQEYSTVKLRIEFPRNYNELYEIELFNDKAPTTEKQATPAPVKEEKQPEATPQKASSIWQLDGTNAQFQKQHSTKVWFGAETYTEATPDGGFLHRGKSSNHYVKLLPKHWIEMEVVKAKRLPGKNYFNWSLHYFKGVGKIAGDVTTIQEGLYTIYLPEVQKALEGPMAMYCYGLEMHFKYIRLTPEPENYLCATVEGNPAMVEPGSKITVTLKLKEPCEDVTCKMMRDLGQGLSPFAINGKDTLELKPVNGDFKLWQAVIDVQNYPSGDKETGKRSVMLRANVLGGKLDTPIITYIPAAFRKIMK